MQKVLLSLLFITTLFAQKEDNTSGPASMNGSFTGNLTLFNYNIDVENEENAYASSIGGYLRYATDNTKPLIAALRFHQSSPVGPDSNREKTLLFNNDRDASSLTALSEAFVAYHSNNRVLKIGDLMLATPMMNDDTTRIVPWSYQGIAFTSEHLSDTKLQFNYITKIRSNTSAEYKKQSASGTFENGISMLGIVYEGIDELSLQSYYYHAPELYSTFIAQLDYKHLLKNHLFCFGLQYFKSGQGGIYNDRLSKDGGDDIDLFATRMGIDTDQWSIMLNYSKNFGLSGIVKGYGGLAQVYTTSMVANGRGNFKPETWMLKTRFDIDPSPYGQTELALWLTRARAADPRGNDFNAFYSHLRHYFSANTSIYLRFETIDYLNGHENDVSYLRIISAYDF